MKELTESIRNTNILVIGDTILDTYYYGAVTRISPEAPVPVMLKKEIKNSLGGAANVAVNLVSAGQDVWLMSLVGDDKNASEIRQLMNHFGIHSELMISCSERRTTEKTRFLTPNGQQLLRVDDEIAEDISEELENEFIQMAEDKIDIFKVIIISDYLKGMVTQGLCQKIIRLGKNHCVPVLIDVKDRNLSKYENSFLLKPNRLELRDITYMPTDTLSQVESAAKELLKTAGCKYVLATLGGEGMMLVSERKVEQFPSVPVEVYDVTGAGDTAMAYLAACIASDISISESVAVSNYAASLQVSKVGTSAVRLEEVERFRRSRHNGQYIGGKLITVEELSSIRNKHKAIVFTNGCFDILHIGHIRYLQEISKLGEILVVGVNGDDSVRKLKGEGRPVNAVADRVEMLAAYSFIDYVVVFDEDTPIELIKKLKPDVLAKGADYKRIEDVVGWDVVIDNGGQVVLSDYVEGKSTTKILDKIKAEELK